MMKNKWKSVYTKNTDNRSISEYFIEKVLSIKKKRNVLK